MPKKYSLILFNVTMIIYFELVFKIFVFKEFFKLNIVFILIFSTIIGLLISILESIFKNTANKIIIILITTILWFIFSAQFIYYQYYETIFSIYSLFHGAQVLEFASSIIGVIFRNIIPILLLTFPLLYIIIFNKKINTNKMNYKYILLLISSILILYSCSMILISIIDKKNTYSPYNLYHNTHVPKLTVKNFGIITEMRLDLQRYVFGFKEKIIINNNDDEDIDEDIEKETIYNIMDIDFEKLINEESNDTIKSMHEYFKSVNPTAQNEYTGMFEGKNLIVIVAEAFSPMAIDKDITPTLYKLYNEGFQFNNFYTPVYYVSTSDGEYVSLTGLLPKDGTWSMSKSSSIYLPFVYGNILKESGYTANAYHNGLYTYYNRDESLPNMGYTYKACYHGLDINCGMWPESDIEMIDASVDEYVNEEHFITYYMTISGHLRYTYTGNSIATKNKKYVENLPYSEGIKAYLATQIELDKAIELLIQKLEAAGKLDDTVIAISADHYPYGLSNDQILEYAKYIDDIKFDLHKNMFLLWNSEIKNNIQIDKYACSLDILPTILNLFNIKYDSRLLIGKDILSDEKGLVIYNDRSWMTTEGKYNAVTDTFTPFKKVDEDYVEKINSEVYNKFLMSKLILENDYYSKVFKKSS